MCHTQTLGLENNNIGDVGVTALANACATGAMAQLRQLKLNGNQIGDKGLEALSGALATGAMAQLQVSWLPTPLSPGPETWHAHSPDPDVSFDVQYAGALALQEQHWRYRSRGSCQGGRRRGNGAVAGQLTPHSPVLWP